MKKNSIKCLLFYSNYVSWLPCIKCKSINMSLNNQECRAGPKIININSNEPLFYPCSIKMYKCSGSCNNVVSSRGSCINDTYAKLCFQCW